MSNRGRFAASTLLAILIGIYCWQPVLSAKWGIIDDHEILNFTGVSGTLPLWRIPGALAQTEVGAPGQSYRYRPAYYALRLLETAAWGRNPSLWYLSRLLMFIFAGTVLLYLLFDNLGFLGISFGIIFLLRAYWADIFARLGPAETYAVLGLGLFVLSFMRIYRAPEKAGRSAWIGLFVGTLVAVGAKENFMPLVIPVMFLGWRLWRRRELNAFALWTLLLTCGFVLWTGTAIIAGLTKTGADIYSHSVSPWARLRILETLVRSRQFELWIFIPFAITALRTAFNSGYSQQHARRFLLSVGILLAIYASQFVFYAGEWPTGNSRYDFPGILALDIAILLCVQEFSQLISSMFWEGWRDHARWFIQAAGFAVFLALNFHTLGTNRTQAIENRDITNKFTTRLEEVIRQVKPDPEMAVVVNAHTVNDYEPVFSVARFLTAYGVRNPLYLHLAEFEPGSVPDGKPRELARRLIEFSANGGRLYRGFRQFPGSPCVSIGVGGDSFAKCVNLGRVW